MPLNGLKIMKIKLSENATKRILFEHVYPENFDGSNDIDERSTYLDQENCNIFIKEKWFEGIHISKAQIQCNVPTEFFFESSQNHIGFLFCLQGEVDYFGKDRE